jgi:hypothetical protein
MTGAGLLFRIEAQPGKEGDVARFLSEELPGVLEGLPIVDWAAVQFGPTEFGVYDTFPIEDGQRSHVGDRIAAALREREADLFEATPRVEGFDVLAGSALDQS